MTAEKLLQKTIDTHGGMAAWNKINALKISVRCGGFALAMRFQAGAYRQYEAVIRTKESYVSFTPFKGHTGIFTPGKVWIEDTGGNILKERSNPRAAFPSLRRSFIWDALDVLYFGGYAMWNYLCAPFIFNMPGLAFNLLSPWTQNNETWQRLEVVFPKSFPTHCEKQTFHINDQGYIRRHDYTAEVIGGYAVAAHYCDNHQNVGGLVFPTRRRVYPRRTDGSSASFPTLIWIDIDAVTLLPETES